MWNYQQVNGLCMNHMLRLIGLRPSAINTFYYLLYKLIVKEELRDGRDAIMYFFVQVTILFYDISISVRMNNVSIPMLDYAGSTMYVFFKFLILISISLLSHCISAYVLWRTPSHR